MRLAIPHKNGPGVGRHCIRFTRCLDFYQPTKRKLPTTSTTPATPGSFRFGRTISYGCVHQRNTRLNGCFYVVHVNTARVENYPHF
jgi:hypothetical protein